MKFIMRKMSGVTLLEIMLVLAVAALLIVMSVRYYSTSGSAEQVNALVEQIQAIVQAADGIAQEQGYNSSSISTSTVGAVLQNTGMTTPWGEPITVAVASTTTLTITVPDVPAAICPLLQAKYNGNASFNATANNCPATGNLASFVITYGSS